MTGTGLIASVTNAGIAPVRAHARRVEKARHCCDLGQDSPGDAGAQAKRNASATPRKLCQSETGRTIPLWNGPRLDPAFVTQLLAQRSDPCAERLPASLFAAYEETAALRTAAPLLDRAI